MSEVVVRLSSLLAPSFADLHREIKARRPSELWCRGGRGSTKSSYISLLILLELTRDPDAHAFVCRRYDNELRDSVFGQLQWAAFHLRVDHLWRFMTSPMQAVNEETGQKILFRGVDNPLKAKSINLGKGYIKIAWFEEVDQYGSMDEIRSILQSVFRGEGKDKLALFSYNPPRSARAWVNREVTITKPGRRVHTSDYRTVPVEWLGERFIADARHLEQVDEVAYRHEYLGEEVGTGLEVFNNVTVRPITDDEKLSFTSIRQGLDFGYAADPLAFVRVHFDARRRRLFVFEEIQGVGLLNRAFAAKTTVDQRRLLTRADKAEPKSIDELKFDHGFNILGADKPQGSVEHGVKWLQELEEIIIDPLACPLAAKEFVNYALETTRTGDVISKFPDKNNHTIDAVRYALEDEIRAVRKSAVEYEPAIPVVNHWS